MAANLDLVRLLVGVGLLTYASVTDLKIRRVRNETWFIGGGIGLLLLVMDYFLNDQLNWVHLGIALAVIAGSYGLWFIHILAGGADAKALMMLAILVPYPVQVAFAAHAFPLWTSPFPPAVIVLANSVLAFVAAPLFLFLYNTLRGDWHLPAMFLGYRLSLDDAARSKVWVVERVSETGELSQVLFASRVTPEEHEANLQRLKERGVARVWITPKIPFMVPLLLGFLAMFFLGDLLTRFLIEPLLPGP